MSPRRRIVSTLSKLISRRQRDYRVLEFGFGHGHLLFWFKPPTRIYGIELSGQAITAAEQRATRSGYPEFQFKNTDPLNSTHIDFPDQFFDLALCSHTLEHVWDDEALLREFHRVLKPGGLLLVVVPHDLRHTKVLADRAERLNPEFPKSSYHVSNYNLESLTYISRRSGFEIIKGERFDAIMSWRDKWSRGVAMLFSSLAVLPYFLFRALDNKAMRYGYPAM